MKLLFVLCLGTLALSAPAPQGGIDFLFDDDETQASVRPVEVNTVEPKVTATKITDPRGPTREPAPVFEEREEEADVEEEEPRPTASPLNLEQNESDTSEPSAQLNETVSDDYENENITESTVADSTESAVTDTTIRVYDEDEVSGTTGKEERSEQEQTQDQDQDHEQEQEQNLEQEQDQDQEQENERNDEQARNNQVNQNAVLDDSYVYDDASLERQLQHEQGPKTPTTTDPESNSDRPTLNEVLRIGLNHETQVVEKGSFGSQDWTNSVTIPMKSENLEYTERVNLDAVHQDTVANDDPNVELKSNQVFNYGTLVLEKGTFEGQDLNPFANQFSTKPWKMGEKSDVPDWSLGPYGLHGPHGPYGPYGPHGPHEPHGSNEPHGPPGPYGPHGPHGTHGPHGNRAHHGPPSVPHSHNEHNRFEGPPPPWVKGPQFHHHHFDSESYEHKGYSFHENGFHRGFPTWKPHWENPNSVPPTTRSPTKVVTLSK